MATKIENFIKLGLKTNLPDVRPGDTVKISQKVPAPAKASADKSEDKKEGTKTEHFEGLVIAKKHGKEMGATITVRREISGIGVERIFPLHLPTIEKIEILKKAKVRRAKLYYLRTAKGQRAKLKELSAK